MHGSASVKKNANFTLAPSFMRAEGHRSINYIFAMLYMSPLLFACEW